MAEPTPEAGPRLSRSRQHGRPPDRAQLRAQHRPARHQRHRPRRPQGQPRARGAEILPTASSRSSTSPAPTAPSSTARASRARRFPPARKSRSSITSCSSPKPSPSICATPRSSCRSPRACSTGGSSSSAVSTKSRCSPSSSSSARKSRPACSCSRPAPTRSPASTSSRAKSPTSRRPDGLAELMTRQHHDPSLFFYFHHETQFPERTILQSTPQFLMELCHQHDQQSMREVDAARGRATERTSAPTVKLPRLSPDESPPHWRPSVDLLTAEGDGAPQSSGRNLPAARAKVLYLVPKFYLGTHPRLAASSILRSLYLPVAALPFAPGFGNVVCSS